MTLGDLLFIMGPDERVQVLYPVEEEAMDEPNDGTLINHKDFGPCFMIDSDAIDLLVVVPKILEDRPIASIESIITKVEAGNRNYSTPALRIILQGEDKVTGREVGGIEDAEYREV